jgi:hypothetical protein
MSKVSKKYKHVTGKMKMLQIHSDAIIEQVISLMKGQEAFCDTFDTLDEKIYTADIFSTLLKDIKTKIVKSELTPNNLKAIKQLKELKKLVKKYHYIHLTNV